MMENTAIPIRLAICGMSGVLLSVFSFEFAAAQTVAATEEIPEEVIQIQVLLESKSQLTGHSQTLSVYAQEQQQLRVVTSEVPPRLDPSIYRAVTLLRLRRLLKSLVPSF